MTKFKPPDDATPLDALRDRWFLRTPPGEAHLNAGTLSPTPRPVLDVANALRLEQATSPSDFFFHRTDALLSDARRALAAFLNVATDGLFLFPNVTFAMNVVMQSLRLAPGDEVLTTDHEYGAMDILLGHIARRDGATIRRVTLPYRTEDPAEIVGAVRRGFNDRTRVLFFCHVTSPSALTLPARELCDLAKERGVWSVVDGAHAPGMLDVDLAAVGADAYGGNCHKWMMAPAGCGFLHASAAMRRELKPLVVSSGAADGPAAGIPATAAQDRSSSTNTPEHLRLEYLGVYDRTPQMALPAAIVLLAEAGRERIADRVATLRAYAVERIEAAGLKRASPRDGRLTSAMTIFDVTDAQADVLRSRLWPEHKVLCPITTTAGRRFLRVSTAWFNTEGEVDQLSRSLSEN